MKPTELVDYAKSLDCIHCGLCLRTCPTYRLTGRESASPRGRIHLMRAVAEGELAPDRDFAEEMEHCLLCRNCETVCPSGVRFGEMMETTRAGLAQRPPRSALGGLARRFGFRDVLPDRQVLSAFATALRLAQRSGLLRLLAPLFGARGRSLRFLPTVPPRRERTPLPPVTPAREPRAGAVAMLEGCVMPELFGRVNRATARVLAAVGLEVRTAAGHVCCGSLHAHYGDRDMARDLARKTIAAFEELQDEAGEPLPIVLNSAGCGAHLRELGHLFGHDEDWQARATALAARIVDVSELLSRPPHRERLASLLGPPQDVEGPIAWDDPCHLVHGQGVRDEPRALLDLVPGLARVELPDAESCCGSAGIYSLVRPEESRRILAEKIETFRASGARTLVTANPGCHMQWESGFAAEEVPARVLHLVEVLDAALNA